MHEQLFKCDKCPKGFGYVHLLEGHINNIHLGLKPHKCDKPGCNKTFARNHNFQRKVYDNEEKVFFLIEQIICFKTYSKFHE